MRRHSFGARTHSGGPCQQRNATTQKADWVRKGQGPVQMAFWTRVRVFEEIDHPPSCHPAPEIPLVGLDGSIVPSQPKTGNLCLSYGGAAILFPYTCWTYIISVSVLQVSAGQAFRVCERVSECVREQARVFSQPSQYSQRTVSWPHLTGTMSELEQLRQEAEQLRNQIRVKQLKKE